MYRVSYIFLIVFFYNLDYSYADVDSSQIINAYKYCLKNQNCIENSCQATCQSQVYESYCSGQQGQGCPVINWNGIGNEIMSQNSIDMEGEMQNILNEEQCRSMPHLCVKFDDHSSSKKRRRPGVSDDEPPSDDTGAGQVSSCENEQYVKENPEKCGFKQCSDGSVQRECAEDPSEPGGTGGQAGRDDPGGDPEPELPVDDNTRAEQVKAQFQELIRQCKEQRNQAAKCCAEPVSCLAESAGAEDGSGYNAAANVGLALAQQMSMMSAESSSQMCGNMHKLGLLGAGVNGAMSVYCGNNIRACQEVCEPVKAQLKMEKQNCDSDPTCGVQTKLAYSELSGSVDAAVRKCTGLNALKEQLQAQAMSTGAGALLAQKCHDAAKVNNFSTGFENVDSQVFNTDCSDPVNASNPICQSQCQRPGAANDPVCRQLLGLDGGEDAGLASSMSTGGSGGENGMEKFGIYEDPDGSQPFEGAGIAPQASTANVGNRAGGGIPTGGGGGGGGSAAASNGGGGRAGSGYNTNILKGFSGGNGYSSKIANRYSASGGGFSGYGNKKPSKGGDKFNLKDYLPGGKKDPRKRRIASVYGLAKHEVQQIGKAHENIFQKISNRYYQVCLKNMLIGCEDMFSAKKPFH